MAFTVKKQGKLNFKKNKTFKILRTAESFLPSSLGGLALWLKADTGITLQTYISQVVLTCTGGLSSFSGTYIANGFPDAGNNYSLSCPANGKSITCEEGRFYLDQNSNVDSYDCINWNLNNQITVGIHINGGDIPEELGGNYYLNERSAGYSDMINGSGGNIQGSLGNWSLYDTATFTLQYSNSSTYGDGQWTNEAGGGELYGSSVILDPDGTISGTVTRSINYGYQTVIEWADQSGNDNNMIADSGSEPTFISSELNGKPVIDFATNKYLTASFSSTNFTQETVFVVFKFVSENLSTYARPFSQSNIDYNDYQTPGNLLPLMRKDGTDDMWCYSPQDDTFLASLPTSNNTWYISTTKTNGSNGSFLLNGSNEQSFSAEFNADITNMRIGGSIFEGGSFNDPFNSKIAEVIVYNRDLTTQERQQVEAYLNQKYQIY